MRQRLAVFTAVLLMIGSIEVPTAEAAVPCAPHAFSVADGVIGAGSCSAAAASVAAPKRRRRRWVRPPGPVYVCEDTLTELNEAFLGESYAMLEEPPPPRPSDEAELRRIRCTVNGVLVGDVFRWFDPQDQGIDLDGVGRQLARSFADELLLPQLAVATDPTTTGLVGLDTWFWVEGWDGETLTRSVVEAGFPFDLKLELEAVTWDFGDGVTDQSESLGAPYPHEEGTIHRFDTRSTSTLDPVGGFDITATVVVAASYSVGGGPFVPVEPIVDQSTVNYVVREAQALIR